jgi:hypothetical protein
MTEACLYGSSYSVSSMGVRTERSRRHYVKNREKILADRKERNPARNRHRNARRGRLQEYVDSVKAETPCADCGCDYPSYVMDFDHVRGKKVANIAKLVSACRPLLMIQDEIAKCDIVCANCHRLRTHQGRV